jgi:two-component system, chemotaxis family, CheB/CheR fusion protein
LSSGRKKTTARRPRRTRTTADRTVPAAPPPDLAAASPADESDEVAAPRPQSAFPIVGVGASAGGLDAFRQLLGALPQNTGMAYVLVQHLDPRHESILAELLAKGSRIPVSEVRKDTAVEPNHVYVTPGQHDVALDGGVLKLVPRAITGGRHLPIDSFLRSLAEAQGSKAIGVILSGTGSDGTLGAKVIKALGGIAFAQDPASAAYDGMPRSAISSGYVDFVLTPERIAKEIARLSRHPYVMTPPGEEPEADVPFAPKQKDALRAILVLLRKGTGADFTAYKPPTIKRRIARRMLLARVETLEEYAAYLEGHVDEVQALYEDCLITVTSFFRDPGTYEALGREFLPRLIKDRAPGSSVRVWVAGCSTGEEAYSLVISLLERAGGRKTSQSFQVFGTDISESALEKARAGRFPSSIAQDVSPERLARFFTEVDGGYQVIKAIRDMCVFARHDVTRDPPFSRMDLISCRNMLIYLEPRQQQRVIALFHYALLGSGLLVLGASETASASTELFAPVDRKHRIYAKRPTASVVFGFGRLWKDGREGPETAPAVKPIPREELPREADRLLLARYAPAGVIIDEKDNIVEFRGLTEPYLEHIHGRASLNLFKMARKGLLADIRQAIQEARKKDAPVRRQGVSLRARGQVRRLDLEVMPLRGSPEKERSLLVLFEARSETRSGSGRAEPRPRLSGAQTRENAELRRELAEATRHLQAEAQQHEAANEELQASNEEVLSANEELQSINEELETAKEELQASNEELATLNQELQGRNTQLGRALDYANGIVETVRNPLLILDAGLRVERANRAFFDYFRIAPEETIGKLIYELGRGQWDIPALRQTLDEILPRAARLEDVEVEHEFPRLGLRTLVINARKLHREAGQESILLAFEDRTEARNTEREREALLGLEQAARQRAEQADRIKDEFMATLSHELRGPLNAMVGWVHALGAGGVDEATRERGMAAIERSVKAQARLTEDLLDYSTVVAGKLRLAAQLMDLVPVAEAALEAVRAAAKAKGIRLDLLTEAKAARIYGDPERLQQILWNLLSNAVKFTPGGGRVEVWIGRVENSFHIRVSDTGEGISKDFLPHVFERFRQQDATSQRRHGGLGLGMAIVKELVELHGGTVRAASRGEGQGATFTVALPIPTSTPEAEDSPFSAPRAAVPSSDRTALAGLRLVVVEDDPDTRDMLVMIFGQSGASVSAVASAAEGLEAIQRSTPDVLVCDIGLSGEDGHALIRKVRALEGETGRRIPALALTAYAVAADRGKALVAGFDLQVSKPAAPKELVAQVALLAGRRGQG